MCYRITNFVLFFIVLLTMCSKGDSPTGPKKNTPGIPEPEGWTLDWNDEFNGTSLDNSKWEYEVNGRGGGNNELQYYTDRPENLFIKDSMLVIQALKENYTGPDGARNYTSARIRTLNKGDWKYGRFDIRAKLPYGQGIWPAFWMLPSDGVYGGWAASGEIDIMELLGQEPQKVYGTLHYGGQYPQNTHTGTSYSLKTGNFAQDFHLFTLEWEEGEIRWYVDGQHYQTQTQWYTTNGKFPAPFNQRFHLLLNLAIGGNWPGSPDKSTIFPQQIVVDYVRVFKKSE
ncbi:glycoside hydrolase family 16 protein [candidate division KSB1 bacterium]|nr:glycoside hydrolase family 16 protein [candidate division KSB1 bacterium]